MPTPPTPPVLSIRLDRSADLPLTAQLAGQVRRLIQSHALGTGDRVPSTRALAVELDVARGVVEQAYDQLLAEGWLQSRRGAGTFVASGVAIASTRRAPADRLRDRPAQHAADPGLLYLDTGTPHVDRRHQAAWRRAWRTVGASVPPATYPDPAGLPELRDAVAEHLGRHRGIACAADNIVITNGTAHGFGLLLDVLASGPVAVEDPGYRAAASSVQATGRALVDTPVDEGGLSLPALRGCGSIAAAYVTPAHQHPLGMPMSAATRVGLIEEAQRRDFVVVEDDYDSEFRYDVAPLPALAQLDPERVVYLGTSSKSLTPALRIGWLVTTADRARSIIERRAARHDHPSWPMQRALLALLEDGYVDRQIRSARRLYAERSRVVRSRLAPFGSTGSSVAGMYVTLETSPAVADSVVAAAARGGVAIPRLADYCRTVQRSGLVVGFGGADDDELEQALRLIETALAEAVRHG